MLQELLLAGLLLAVSVTIHALVLAQLLGWLSGRALAGPPGFWRATWLLIGVAARLVVSHLLQVACWGAYFHWHRAFADFTSAAYFSLITYATVGYGDLVPPEDLRLTAGVLGLTGILMCGWSTAVFFATVSRMHRPLSGGAGAP